MFTYPSVYEYMSKVYIHTKGLKMRKSRDDLIIWKKKQTNVGDNRAPSPPPPLSPRKLLIHISGVVDVLCSTNNSHCTMLHLFDDLWLDKIIPKNNDRNRAIYGNLEIKINTLYWPVDNSIPKNNDRSSLQHCVIHYCIIWNWCFPKKRNIVIDNWDDVCQVYLTRLTIYVCVYFDLA